MDITYIPIELIENTEFKYILNVIVHFSKYLFSFLLENKNSETFVSKLNLCFKKNRYPKQIRCDNGSEFNNIKVKTLLNNKNILMIRGNHITSIHRELLKE